MLKCDCLIRFINKWKDWRRRLHVSVPELLRNAAEELVRNQARPQLKKNGDWRFPEGRNLGAFCAAVEDWRLQANEAGV